VHAGLGRLGEDRRPFGRPPPGRPAARRRGRGRRSTPPFEMNNPAATPVAL